MKRCIKVCNKSGATSIRFHIIHERIETQLIIALYEQSWPLYIPYNISLYFYYEANQLAFLFQWHIFIRDVVYETSVVQ